MHHDRNILISNHDSIATHARIQKIFGSCSDNFFLDDEWKYGTNIIRPPTKNHLNGVSGWLGRFVIFHVIQSSIAKKSYRIVIFHGGSGPLFPLWISTCNQSGGTIVFEVVIKHFYTRMFIWQAKNIAFIRTNFLRFHFQILSHLSIKALRVLVGTAALKRSNREVVS